MLDNLTEDQVIRQALRSDPKLACEKARGLVAANPNDESAAALLTEAVQKFAAEHRSTTDDREFANAAPDVQEAYRLLHVGEDEQAEGLLRNHLSANRDDPLAMRLMAQIAAKCGFFANAERIARWALSVDPKSTGIRLVLARVLFFHGSEQEGFNGPERALELVDEAIELDPGNRAALNARATFLSHLRRPAEALKAFDVALDADPFEAEAWIAAGMVHRNLGQVGLAVAAFRTALALNSSISRAWLELANLKTVKLSPSDAPLMARALEQDRELDDAHRAELHFSLFKAYDDGGDREAAALHLAEGNKLKRQLHPYDAAIVTRDVTRSIGTFSSDFFARTEGMGDDSDELIFVIGMYRAGSTLVEQILSSHSQIEGTEELPYVLKAVADIQAARPGLTPEEFLSSASREQIEGMSGVLLNLSRSRKQTSKPYFLDKNPANWRFVGLIHTLLPKARFIDVRRNPLDCCFANYAQHYGAGVEFSYDQHDLAQFYAEYLRLMRHFEPLLPGRYHRVIYEDLVDAPETEIRRLLDFLGLRFEESCLRFFETERPVYTPSAQQVRQPINRAGIDRWKPYRQWLKPMIAQLGDLPSTYRN